MGGSSSSRIDGGIGLFRHFLVEQGLEVDVESEIYDLVDFIDDCVSKFEYGEYGFSVSSGRGVIGSEWKLLVRPKLLADPSLKPDPIGFILVQKVDAYTTRLLVPPHRDIQREHGEWSDLDGKLFLNLICQMLNGLQERNYVELPGLIPVE